MPPAAKCLYFAALFIVSGAGDDSHAETHLPITPHTPAETARIKAVVAPTTDFTKPEPFEARSAGAATSFAHPGHNAFSHASANMSFERELTFKVGNGLFKKIWVSAPASTDASDGLGPLYNARACQRCHLKDGRGHPPKGPSDSAVSMFLRISQPVSPSDITKSTSDIAFPTEPNPVYGLQLQDLAIAGHKAEGVMVIDYETIKIPLSDGETATLQSPRYRVDQLGYGPLSPFALLSPRIAPQMIGLGLLEAIPEAELRARADPDDANGDGVSGRARMVDSIALGRKAMGRFGLKAGAATIKDQVAAAFAGDMGLSTSYFPDGFGECTVEQTICRSAPHGGSEKHGNYEVSDEALDLVTFYAQNLAVPARRKVDNPIVLHGKSVFYASGCIACHTPKHVTHRLQTDGETAQPEQSFQLIWPYTDLLLHDMGEGLADHRPEGQASGREWRTAPLWGIGLTEEVNGHTRFLHDGRARNLLEAILWHGGEAQGSRDEVIAMPKRDRDALLRFLGSL
jgi:CxxC motif-containing protein (DUF1111 family)